MNARTRSPAITRTNTPVAATKVEITVSMMRIIAPERTDVS